MRLVKEAQLQFGQVNIADIKFDPRSRDDIPQLLRGLQYIYTTPEIREEVFQILETLVPQKIDPNNGRPGMELWKILVLGTIRLNLNCDYDRVQELANNHKTLREMLGHGIFDRESYYKLQTIKDNVSLLTVEALDKINQVVVRAGHKVLKKKDQSLRGRSDSFVVETNVHYPTDANLLLDSIRKSIELVAGICQKNQLSDWRQYQYNIRQIKRTYRTAQKIKRSTSKDVAKQEERKGVIASAYQAYLDLVESAYKKIENTLTMLTSLGLLSALELVGIEYYTSHVKHQLDLVDRRIIRDEKIPHAEKVFSIFQPHTEWISKGKAGVPVEFGLRVNVIEDQYQFILHHQVMQQKTDEQIAVSFIKEVQERFPELAACSLDKGFHSPTNQKGLSEILEQSVLPRKGRLNQKDKETESSDEFKKARRQHSAVESAINALEVHGLDKCSDHGIGGFKRYVALAIVGRNVQRIGAILRQKELRLLQKWRKKAA